MVLCLVAAVAYAVGVVAQKPLLGAAPGAAGHLAGVPDRARSLPAVRARAGPRARRADASTIGWLVYLGVFPTALAFTTWAYALARTSAGKLGATTYLVPPSRS